MMRAAVMMVVPEWHAGHVFTNGSFVHNKSQDEIDDYARRVYPVAGRSAHPATMIAIREHFMKLPKTTACGNQNCFNPWHLHLGHKDLYGSLGYAILNILEKLETTQPLPLTGVMNQCVRTYHGDGTVSFDVPIGQTRTAIQALWFASFYDLKAYEQQYANYNGRIMCNYGLAKMRCPPKTKGYIWATLPEDSPVATFADYQIDFLNQYWRYIQSKYTVDYTWEDHLK
jgi:hypothetical protein